MPAMQWTFADSGNGEEHGFNAPGIETFKDGIERYLAREIIQNTLDAREDQDQPVVVSFQLELLSRDDIPEMDVLADAFPRCAKYRPKDGKAKAFFDRAAKLAKSKTIA